MDNKEWVMALGHTPNGINQIYEKPANFTDSIIGNKKNDVCLPFENHVDTSCTKNSLEAASRERVELGTNESPKSNFARHQQNSLNYRGQLDIIEMKEDSHKNYKYLLVYEDKLSTYVILKPLKSNSVREIAGKLLKLFLIIGVPRVLQSQNGRNFIAEVVKELRNLWGNLTIVHGNVFSNSEKKRDFKSLLESWKDQNPSKTWYEGLKFIQILENTRIKFQNEKSPQELLFGKHVRQNFQEIIGETIKREKEVFTEEDLMELCNIKEENGEIEDNLNLNVSRNEEILDRDFNLRFKASSDKSWSPESEPRESNCTEPPRKTRQSARQKEEEFHLRCKICQKTYLKLGHLKNHMKTHRKIKKLKFECNICSKSFRTEESQKNHMEKFHEEKSSVGSQRETEIKERIFPNTRSSCQKEGKRFFYGDEMDSMDANNSLNEKSKTEDPSFEKTPTKRSKRSSRVSEESLLECTFCNQKFDFPSVLKRHMRSHTNERPYVCQICNKSFKQLGHLSQHSLTHLDYRSFQCTICDIKFESLDLLKVHSQSHGSMVSSYYRSKEIHRLFECDNCKKVFTTKSVLERHILTHTHERHFECSICGKRFKQAGHVKSHMLVHTGERKFQCSICSKRFTLSNSLKKHMYVHNGEKPYQCDICGSRFLERRNLNGHLMTHTNERPFSCKICGKKYTLADTLRRHISAAHEDGRTYQCEICAKMFKQLAHLSVHKKVHNDERPFQCHLCDKNFKHKNVLKSHLAIHANVRPFECDTCKATFVRKTNLQTHIASAHMNERPYVCKICNKRFKQISHLNGHVVVHSNSMPYQCEYCERRCNRLDNLKKHMRLHMRNKEN